MWLLVYKGKEVIAILASSMGNMFQPHHNIAQILVVVAPTVAT